MYKLMLTTTMDDPIRNFMLENDSHIIYPLIDCNHTRRNSPYVVDNRRSSHFGSPFPGITAFQKSWCLLTYHNLIVMAQTHKIWNIFIHPNHFNYGNDIMMSRILQTVVKLGFNGWKPLTVVMPTSPANFVLNMNSRSSEWKPWLIVHITLHF